MEVHRDNRKSYSVVPLVTLLGKPITELQAIDLSYTPAKIGVFGMRTYQVKINACFGSFLLESHRLLSCFLRFRNPRSFFVCEGPASLESECVSSASVINKDDDGDGDDSGDG